VTEVGKVSGSVLLARGCSEVRDDDELMCLIAFGLIVVGYVFGEMWAAVNAIGSGLRGLL
jgi:hypothetical protein